MESLAIITRLNTLSATVLKLRNDGNFKLSVVYRTVKEFDMELGIDILNVLNSH